MGLVTKISIKLGILTEDLDYHLVRASMVIIFLFFGYQKWFKYEAQALIPYISKGPLLSWMYTVFGIRGATYFLGAAEWLFGGLLFLGFWNKTLGILGALGSCFAFFATITIIPFIRNGWAISAGGASDDRDRCFPFERSSSLGCIRVSAAAGCSESVAVC
jgi:uncharacterized membrane protein YkgB